MNWLSDNGLELRRLLPTDLDAAANLARRAFARPSIAAEVRTMLLTYCKSDAYLVPLELQSRTMLPVSYYLLAQVKPKEESVIGLTGLYRPVWAGQGVYWIGWFAVDPQFHGQGYGTRLLEATVVLAAARGGRLLCVETARTLDSAVRLYSRAGFKECGQVPDYWEPGVDLLILARSLQDIVIPEGVPNDL